jgi:hypothetical protein
MKFGDLFPLFAGPKVPVGQKFSGQCAGQELRNLDTQIAQPFVWERGVNGSKESNAEIGECKSAENNE